MKTFNVSNSIETQKVGFSLGKLLSSGDVILLEGDLSAGKTTFTKGIGEALGVKKVINSPTFTIVKTYKGTNGTLYHMDLYRLDGLGNDFDLYEYFEGDGICVVEWPHQVDEILPEEYILVIITITGLDRREIKIESIGEKYKKIVGEISCTL